VIFYYRLSSMKSSWFKTLVAAIAILWRHWILSRSPKTIWLILFSIADMVFPRLAVATPAPLYPAKIEQTKYDGWSAFRLSNGLINLYIAPEIGGRAIQLEIGGRGLFFVNPSLAGKVLPETQNNLKTGWANYGGDKVWPAPEGWMSDDEWSSIPYYTLDGSPFASQIVKDTPAEVALRVTSPPDPRTGVQFSRIFRVDAGDTRITVEQVMRNISKRQIRWGIWHLIQSAAADAQDPSKPNRQLYVYAPLNPHSIFPQGYTIVYGDAENPSYRASSDGKLLRVHYAYRVGKVALDSNAGWYAVVNGQKNIGFVETFRYFRGLEYPDGASVESWNEGPGKISRGPFVQTLLDDPQKTPYFLETEVLSPYATLDPGEQTEFTVHWAPTSVTNPIVKAVWAGAISQPFSVEADGTSVVLKGTFGVFVPGELVANFYSAMGEVLGQEELQAVDPRQVVRLDKAVAMPANTFRISIYVRDSEGQNRGYLGNLVLLK
jgi:Domain of unknown function (DUF4380)